MAPRKLEICQCRPEKSSQRLLLTHVLPYGLPMLQLRRLRALLGVLSRRPHHQVQLHHRHRLVVHSLAGLAADRRFAGSGHSLAVRSLAADPAAADPAAADRIAVARRSPVAGRSLLVVSLRCCGDVLCGGAHLGMKAVVGCRTHLVAGRNPVVVRTGPGCLGIALGSGSLLAAVGHTGLDCSLGCNLGPAGRSRHLVDMGRTS